MALTITHSVVSGAAANSDVDVDGVAWDANHTIAGSIAASEVTSGAELSKTDDTNVTLTLGGTPTTALLKATSVTVGWTGTLAAARLNSNVVQAITNDTNVTGSIAAQNLTLGWTGTLAAARLNSNVVQSAVNDTNVTGSIAAQALTLGWTGTLAVARGGTGSATAADARTALGLAIGSDVQAYDAELAAVAGLTSAADKGFYFTGIGTAATYDLTSYGRSIGGVANEAAFKALVNLEIGTDVQAYDAELAAIAGLTSAADKAPYFTGSGTAAVADFTASGRAMVGAASAAAQTALLSAVVGDSGSGGTKGLVPAPAAGDAAASKFLKADGTWTAPSGTGDMLAANNLSDVANAATAFGNIKQAASDSATGVLEIAVQSEMETGTSTTLAVTPGRQQYHPSAAKAWCRSDGATTPAISASYNVTSLTDNGVGDTTFNFTTAMSSVSYSVVALFRTSVTFSTDAAPRSIDIVSLATGGARIATGAWISPGSVAIDYPIHMVAFGDQ